jgi:hypothetical protein
MNTKNTKKRRHKDGNSDPTEEEIAECAYFIWESEGHPIGREAEHWRQAELQLYLSRAHDDAMESTCLTY